MTTEGFFRTWEDNTEHFLGIEINEKKMERLNKMRSLCREVASRDSGITAPFNPFSTKEKNASVFLEFTSPLWTFDTTITNKLSELFSMADGFAIAEGDGSIRITFDILDMWDKFGYDNDMEHGK